MKALYKSSPAAGLEFRDLPEPEPGPGEVKIRVLRTGICGTDLHIESWDAWAAGAVNAPLIPGHEFCGEVVAVATDVVDISIGDFVSGEGHVVCGRCRNCQAGRRHLCIRTSSLGVNRDGAFAEYVVIPSANVWVHHDEVSPDLAAIFDPLGNAVHTALTYSLVGEDVLITGAGPIGAMAAAISRHVGARFVVITDISEYRLALARRMGVDLALNSANESLADAQSALGMVEGFDVAMEMSGHPQGLRDILQNITFGSRVAMLGLPSDSFDVDWSRVVTRMITIKGIYGREMFGTWYTASALIKSGLDPSPVITHRFSADEWAEAFQTARSGHCGKIILNWE
ncbi:MAG: L-threonine 3-dehydrogenase [bacterium]|nr:L-threonine 3-dehydrogenase [bacterium]